MPIGWDFDCATQYRQGEQRARRVGDSWPALDFLRWATSFLGTFASNSAGEVHSGSNVLCLSPVSGE